jgi:hypothetical protein
LVGTLLGLNMKLALLYGLNFSKMYIHLEKYVIYEMKFRSNVFEFIRVEGA